MSTDAGASTQFKGNVPGEPHVPFSVLASSQGDGAIGASHSDTL